MDEGLALNPKFLGFRIWALGKKDLKEDREPIRRFCTPQNQGFQARVVHVDLFKSFKATLGTTLAHNIRAILGKLFRRKDLRGTKQEPLTKQAWNHRRQKACFSWFSGI